MSTELLLSPLQFGDLKLPNRVVMAPLTRQRAGLDDHVPTQIQADYYAQRASAGLIIAEATAISPDGFGWAAAGDNDLVSKLVQRFCQSPTDTGRKTRSQTSKRTASRRTCVRRDMLPTGHFFEEMAMSVYIVVELTTKNQEARDRYAAAAKPVLQEFGGEFIGSGAWEMLFGDPAFTNGAIIRFADKATALAWYNSPGYQAALTDRAEGIDCRFRMLG